MTLRLLLLGAVILVLFPICAAGQIRFLENGMPTRTGADVGMYPDSPMRQRIDLSGTWKYSLDKQTWSTVTVPSCYDGTANVTFMRTFTVTESMLDSCTFSLVGFGINNQCEITVNGEFVGRHMGGYTSFVYALPSNVIQVGSENAIVISVSNELTPRTTLPPRQQVGSWRSYGGIFRDLFILATPKLFIESAGVVTHATPDGKTGTISVNADITDRGSDTKEEPGSLLGFQIEVYEKLTGAPVGRSGITPLQPQVNKSVSLSAQVSITGVKFWSPEVPDLYTVRCQIVRLANKVTTTLDEYSFDTGFKNFQWADGRLVVNGIPLTLKGLLWMEDHVNYGSSMTYEALERDIASIKAVGANLVRFLSPPHPYVINLCDRYGLLVLEDVPLRNAPARVITDDYFQEVALNSLKEMLARDKHHVSILAWGIGDEFETETGDACAYVTGAREVIRSVDARPVYYASRHVETACQDKIDLLAINSYTEDIKVFRSFLESLVEQAGSKPLIITRYGRNIEPGNRNGYSDPRSVEAQGRQIMQWFEAMKEANLAGCVLWAYSDWRSDRPALTTHAQDPYLQSFGIVGYDREKRISYEVARAVFNGEKVQAMPIGSYAQSAPIIYVVAGLVVLIAFAFMYNANRRYRDCVNRSVLRTYNFFADVRDQRILATAHTLFLAAIISATWAIVASSLFTHYRESLLLDNLLSQVFSDTVKEWLVILVWNPAKFIVISSSLIFFGFLILTTIVKLMSMFVKTYVYFYHSFSIVIWSMLPFVILIPFSMILYRLMDSEVYVVPVIILVGGLTVWTIVRLFKGISIIYDIYPVKVYVGGTALIVICLFAVYAYLDYTQSTSLYVQFLLRTARGSM